MKKLYFLLVLFIASTFVATAQDYDDMESYTPGSPICAVNNWTDWDSSCGAPLMASDAITHSGVVSGYVGPDNAADAIYDMGGQIFGAWGIQFWMYVPAGSSGYFNMQGIVPVGAGEWVIGNVFFNEAGATPGEGYIDYSSADTTFWKTFTFPHDEWFRVTMNYNLESGMSNATWDFGINTTVVVDGDPYADAIGTTATSLGGIDFYSFGVTNDFYIDDVDYRNEYFDIVSAGVSDLAAKGFAAYPNPVKTELNLTAKEAISSVAVYNVLGQEVYNANVNALNTTINTANWASGAYFVKVNIAGTEGIVKILK